MNEPDSNLEEQLIKEHEQFTAQIDQKYGVAMGVLTNIHRDINVRFGKLEELKEQYLDIQEKKFLKAFINIMDKMSTELQQATEAYDCIDKEINEDPKCLYLQKELEFFQGECINTRKQLQLKKKHLEGEKEKQRILMKERESLTFRLRSATEKDIKYTVRAQSLCKEEKQSEYQLFTQRKSVILNTSRPESLARSRNYSLQFQTQPKHSRKSFEKLPVSTAMRTSNSKNQTTKLY